MVAWTSRMGRPLYVAGHPDDEAVLVVVATGLVGDQVVVKRRAAHFRQPHDESLVEEAARLEIVQKAGGFNLPVYSHRFT